MAVTVLPEPRRRGLKVTLSVALVALVAASLVATWSAFSNTTSNTNNQFDTAKVTIVDNDGGSTAMFPLASHSNLKPGDVIVEKCIEVHYTGDVAAKVKLYGTTTGAGLDPYLNVKVTRGTTPASPAFPGCGVFTADSTEYLGVGQGAGVVFNGTLTSFPDDYATGIDFPASVAANTKIVYKFEVTLANDNAAQDKDVTQSFTWEARAGTGS